jgi:hypothetical protein
LRGGRIPLLHQICLRFLAKLQELLAEFQQTRIMLRFELRTSLLRLGALGTIVRPGGMALRL